MGCWYRTCVVSKLPIHYRDPVRCFLVGQKSLDQTWGQRFEAITLPIRGTYDNYGRLETFADNFYTKNHFLSCFKPTPKSVEDVIGAEKGTLSPSDPGFIDGQHHVVMCHEQMFQEVVRLGWNEDNEYLKGLYNFLKTFVAVSIKSAEEKDGMYIPDLIEEGDFASWYLSLRHYRPVGHLLYAIGSEATRPALCARYNTKIADDYSFDPDVDFPPELQNLMAEAFLFDNGLRVIRRAMEPEPWSGSQEQAYEDHIKFAQQVIDFAQRQIQKRDW